MNKAIRPAVLLLAAALSACGSGGGAPGGGERPPLEGARIGGPFRLVDQDGRAVTEASWPGRWRAVYFGYTYCPDVCPLDLQRLMQGYRQFASAHPAEAAKVQPLFVTVDPARDTPAAMKRYVAAFGAPLVGLTGSEAQVDAAAQAYGVFRQKREEPGSTEYLMDHSRTTTLFDPAGRPVVLLPTDADAGAVAAAFARWVR